MDQEREVRLGTSKEYCSTDYSKKWQRPKLDRGRERRGAKFREMQDKNIQGQMGEREGPGQMAKLGR